MTTSLLSPLLPSLILEKGTFCFYAEVRHGLVWTPLGTHAKVLQENMNATNGDTRGARS